MKVMNQELENVENVSWHSFFEEKNAFHNSMPLPLQSAEEVHPAEGRNSGFLVFYVLHLFSEIAVD